jgi:hypothetical protein
LVQAQNVESIDLKLRARQTAQPRGWRFDSDAYAKKSQITMPRVPRRIGGRGEKPAGSRRIRVDCAPIHIQPLFESSGRELEPRQGLCRQIATGGLQFPDLTQRRQASFGLGGVVRLMSQFAILDLASVEGRWQLTLAEDDGRLVVIVTHFGIPRG